MTTQRYPVVGRAVSSAPLAWHVLTHQHRTSLSPVPPPTLLTLPSHPAAPRIHTLIRQLETAGCPLNGGGIVCEDAFGSAPVAAGYDSSRHLVVMNPGVPSSFLNQGEWTRAVAHELVHAFDACRAKFDPDDCSHIACTEIRAANLSGDCDFGVELSRAPSKMLLGGLGGHQQACVKRRAELSLSMHEPCAAKKGEQAGMGPDGKPVLTAPQRTVAAVWDRCYKDNAPFSSN
jgi:inner membrane protease ATP23